MSLRRTSLLSAATLASLGVSLAGAAANANAASLTLATSAELTAALTTLNGTYGPTIAANVVHFEATPTTAYLGVIDTLIDAAAGSTVITAPSHSAPTAPALEATLAALHSLLPASPSAAQQQALAQAQAALIGGGFGVLTAGVSGSQTAINQLSAAQKLNPGASTATGGLNAVGAIATALAAEAAGGDQSSLSGAATTLDSTSALTPAQLQSAIGALQSVSSAAASGTSGVTVAQVAAAVADELAQSGSLLGELGTVGAALSDATDANDITTALAQLSALTGLAPAASASLAEIGQVLNQIAATPSVSGTAAAGTLTSAAATLTGSSLSAAQVISVATTLTGVGSSLPAPLSTLTSALGAEIASSGSVFGTVTGLSSANVQTALGELTTLAGLGAGAQAPELPGIAAVLSQVASDIPAADTMESGALGDLASAISANTLTASDLAGAAQTLTYVATTLPWPVQPTIAGLASTLSSDATNMAAPGAAASGSAGAGTSSSGSSASSSTTSSSSSSLSPVASAAKPAPTPGTTTSTATTKQAALIKSAVRSGNRVTVTLECTAAKGKRCADTVRATEAGYRTTAKHVALGRGKTKRVTLKLTVKAGTSLAARRSAKRAAIKLTVVSGSKKVSKILR